MSLQTRLESAIRDVPDFPKPGILFKDITPILGDGPLFQDCVRAMAAAITPAKPDLIAGPESRGFLFGAALSQELGIGFVPIRKPGKLPWRKRSVDYALEYGTDTVEVHEDAFEGGKRVALVDDLLATGGTIAACAELVEACDAEVVHTAFLIELAFLKGRERYGDRPATSLLTYS